MDRRGAPDPSEERPVLEVRPREVRSSEQHRDRAGKPETGDPGTGFQEKTPLYASSAGWPPRCAYRTVESLPISPCLIRSISPAIDFPS